MGLKDEFRDGVKYLDDHLSSMIINSRTGQQSLFETNIRLLGGLDGAHSLCLQEEPALAKVLLRLAKEVGDRFMPAFDKSILPCLRIGTHFN